VKGETRFFNVLGVNNAEGSEDLTANEVLFTVGVSVLS